MKPVNAIFRIFTGSGLKKLSLTITTFSLLLSLLFSNGVTAQAQSGPTAWASLSVTLYAYNPNGSNYVADGVLVNYANKFSNYVDDDDAIKLFGGSTSLAINRHDTMLVIERRHTITCSDTIPLSLKTPTVGAPFMLELKASGFQPGIMATVYDSYLGTSSVINMQGTVDIAFTVTNSPGSNAANRFLVNLAPTRVLPVTFTSVKASQQGNGVNVLWNVAREYNVKQYILQHSADGISFSDYSSRSARANTSQPETYHATYNSPSAGMNYFRIKSVDFDNKFSYTQVVSISVDASNRPTLSVAASGNYLTLIYTNQQAGAHALQVLNVSGQVLLTTPVDLQPGKGTYPLYINGPVPHGVYYILIKSAGQTQSISVVL